MLTRLHTLARSHDAFDGLIMAGASLIAGGFAYLVLVAAGLLLDDAAAIAFLAIMNVLKIAEQVTWVIRNVVAYYLAELAIGAEPQPRMGAFLRDRWRWAWQWGVVTAVLFALLSPFIGRLINVDSRGALLAAALALLLLFVRPVTDGALQGSQQFWGLGSVTVLQELLRFGLTIGLILAGLQLAGAVLALPLASLVALGLAVWWLRPTFRAPATDHVQKVSLPYSLLTLAGLFSFALLVYSDAILVNRIFPPEVAAQYTPANILARLNLFVPIAIGMVLFPKATQKHTLGQDARPYLLLALAATLIPGLLLTLLYFLFPGPIVELVFRGQYDNPGRLLGWVGLVVTLYAGVNIWLNYALAVGVRPYIFLLAIIVVGEVTAVLLLAHTLQTLAFISLLAGLSANLAGLLLLRPSWSEGRL
jgi:O-antigen/teichoic acid export membrane protein